MVGKLYFFCRISRAHVHVGNGGRGGNEGGWNAAGRDNGMSYRAYAFRDNACLVNETHQDYAIFQIYHGRTEVN